MTLTTKNAQLIPLTNQSSDQGGRYQNYQLQPNIKKDSSQAARKLLRQTGFYVVTPTNLADARRRAPHALIVILPDPDSSSLCRSIRADAVLQHTPILLACRRSAQDSEVNAALQAGADDYLSLPCQPEQLRFKLAQLQERRWAQQGLERARQELRSLSARLESIREEERIRLAREIHDDLGQCLTGLKMDVAWLKKHLGRNPETPQISQRLTMMQGLMDETVNWVRRIAGDLRPAMLDDIGLLAAIEWETSEFQNRSGIACHLTARPPAVHLTPEAATVVFRIFKEMLTNVARHAKARHIEIRLSQTATAFSLSVCDDGCGFARETLHAGRSLGVLGMSERAASMGGKFTLHSQPNQGTMAQVSLPLVCPV